MSSEDKDQKSSVDWGKLGKNILAGAAIVAGLVIVVPGLAPALAAGIAGIGTSIASAGAGVGATHMATAAAASAAPEWITAGITKLLGLAIAAAGATYFLGGKKDDKDVESPSVRAEADESFAAREDMRKMQAVMMARMQAQGYQPAMALANQQGR